MIKKNLYNCIFFALFCLSVFLISHRSNFNFKLFTNFYKVDYGYKESMIIYKKYHFHANEIRKIIYKYDLKKFNIDSELLGDPFIFESSYPSMYSDSSEFYFSKKNKKTNCILIEKATKINLFKCE